MVEIINSSSSHHVALPNCDPPSANTVTQIPDVNNDTNASTSRERKTSSPIKTVVAPSTSTSHSIIKVNVRESEILCKGTLSEPESTESNELAMESSVDKAQHAIPEVRISSRLKSSSSFYQTSHPESYFNSSHSTCIPNTHVFGSASSLLPPLLNSQSNDRISFIVKKGSSFASFSTAQVPDSASNSVVVGLPGSTSDITSAASCNLSLSSTAKKPRLSKDLDGGDKGYLVDDTDATCDQASKKVVTICNQFLPLFGIAISTRMYRSQIETVKVVMEEFLRDRWIIFYHISEGKWVVFARYILFDSWNSLRGIVRKFAPIRDVGVSLEDPSQYLVVEQSHIQYLLLYLVEQNGFHLLKKYEMEPVIHRSTEIEMKAHQEESAAANHALMIIPRVNSIIIERHLVATMYEQLAYVVETSGPLRWLFIYSWCAGVWHRQSQYEAVNANHVEIKSYCAPITFIFQQNKNFNKTLVVVEETTYMRWWHTYLWKSGMWKYSMSHQLLICRTA